jgi:hypothetical protein
MTRGITTTLAALIVFAFANEAGAQPRRQAPPRPFVERGFVIVGGGVQATAADLTDRILFETNAETGSIDADYPGRTGVLADVTVGMRVRRQVGIAVGVSRAARNGRVQVTAQIPHPFFDEQPRSVSGEAGAISRTETAVHGQLYYDMRPRGRWRVRLFGGPSYFAVEQEVVTGVEADEVYPFDTAEFRRATTARAKGSAVGFNAGLDFARMFNRRVGAGGLVRYSRASVDLDAPAARRVSTDGGGMQATIGLRFLF